MRAHSASLGPKTGKKDRLGPAPQQQRATVRAVHLRSAAQRGMALRRVSLRPGRNLGLGRQSSLPLAPAWA